MKTLVMRLIRDESGQDLIEYALLAAFIALVALGGIKTLGEGVNTIFGNISTQLTPTTE